MKCRKWKRVLTAILTVALMFGSINMTAFVSRAVENAYEATSGTHGATYDATSGQVTFWVKSTDACYSQTEAMWYKEYATYEDAAQAHISSGGNFIVDVDATSVVENAEATEKTAVATVSEGTGAILYYFNAGAGHARPDYEHIIVIGDSSNEDDGNGTGGDVTPSEGYVNLEEKSGVTDGTTFWAGNGADATVAYAGESAVVTANAWGSQDAWSIQWAVQDFEVSAGKLLVEYDIVATVDKPVLSKLTAFASADNDTPIIEAKYDLTANESKHYSETATIGADGKVRLFFNLGGGNSAGTVTISNVKLVAVTDGGSGDGSGDDDDDDKPIVTPSGDYINLEEKSKVTDGVSSWIAADASDAVITYDKESVIVTASTWGQQEWWSVQWSVQDIDVTAGDWYVEYDIVSTISKPVLSKLTAFGTADNDTPIIEAKYDLTANEPKHYSEKASIGADGKVRLFFNLAGGSGAGTVTISNVRVVDPANVGGGTITQDAPVLESAKGASKTEGYKVGDNVVLNFAADATAWAEAISAVKVNNKTVDTAKYTVAEGTLTLDSSVFTKQGIYTVEVEATGYKSTSTSLPVYDAEIANENWIVKWEDQFNGTELDTTKWSYEIGIQSGEDGKSDAPIYWGNNEKQYYTKEAVEVKDGHLIITGDKLTQDVKNQYGVTDSTVQYTSGRIRTITDDGDVLAATTYGRIEALMSLPAAQGYWPAFWMLPTPETTDIYGTWAASGELDIMEAVGQNPTQINGTIHYGGQWPNNAGSGGTYVFPNNSTIAEEHLYAVEWEPGEIRWYVDDVLFHVENNWYAMNANGEEFSYPAPYDEDFYILLNLAMSGNYVSNVMPKDDELGKQMKVDYVRILTDENTDYDDSDVIVPDTDRDSAFLEANGGYTDLIVDKDYATLPENAYGDGAMLLPGNELWWSSVNTGAGANATVEVVDGVAKINVTKTGTYDYNVQLIQNIPLAQGYTYRVTFDAWTDVTTGRTIRVAPGGDCNHDWTSYSLGLSPALTTEKKTFTYDFLMAKDSDPSARFEMNLGGAQGTVYIDNVSVVALTDEQLAAGDAGGAKDPLSNGEHIYNGTFDKGTGKLGSWTTEGTKGSAENRNYTVTVGAEAAKLIQKGIKLLEQDEYELTFDALTGKAGKVRVVLTDENGETVYATEEYELTTESKPYKLGFTVPADKGTDLGKLTFEFIGEGETVTVDNVSMKRLTNVGMEWDQYELYPIGTGDECLSGWTTYDEVWNWAVKPISATDIGNGEKGFAVATVPANQAYMVMLQNENVNIANGLTYRIKYAVKSSVADQPVNVSLEDATYTATYTNAMTVGTEWTYVDTTFTSSLAGAGALKFLLAGVDQDCTIYIKDVYLELAGIPVPQFAEGSEVTELAVGESAKLDIEYSVKVKDKYKSFTYESSDAEVLAVAEDGTLTAKKEGKATITVTSVLGTEFSFEVQVVADEKPAVNPFADVSEGEWFYDFAMYAYENKLMTGTGEADGKVVFEPLTTMERSMFVQVLYSIEGKPSVEYKDVFGDVKEDDWFADAVIWAKENDIVAGIDENTFDVKGFITREQMVAILYKYAMYKGYDVKEAADLTDYTDEETLSDYAVPGMKWAVAKGVIGGQPSGEGDSLALNPKGNASRAEAATMFMRFKENVEK